MNPIDFADFHQAALEGDAVRHNLPLSIIERLRTQGEAGGIKYWTLGDPGACALQTPGFPLLLCNLSRDECRRFADLTADLDFADVVGTGDTALQFPERAREHGIVFDEEIPQAILSLDEAPTAPSVEGFSRLLRRRSCRFSGIGSRASFARRFRATTARRMSGFSRLLENTVTGCGSRAACPSPWRRSDGATARRARSIPSIRCQGFAGGGMQAQSPQSLRGRSFPKVARLPAFMSTKAIRHPTAVTQNWVSSRCAMLGTLFVRSLGFTNNAIKSALYSSIAAYLQLPHISTAGRFPSPLSFLLPARN
ncbi:hypothetical protein Rvan_3334 [Rhodomicrobium vannielii ATCC 17100]|uniref:Uncharacterized protein n=1 Tax=Rhodomicrobium vannielii (strain ATCC 17100 / DSM 162 / LMG 4299 / NCIMB 10020 / ATH 3.1.1) TaxID=648757 RepID=E3I2S4_RHOVT|nr:hypothetical protein Rvan_3334 [Rhodomicrobium vannielii ATCC 17100]